MRMRLEIAATVLASGSQCEEMNGMQLNRADSPRLLCVCNSYLRNVAIHIYIYIQPCPLLPIRVETLASLYRNVVV